MRIRKRFLSLSAATQPPWSDPQGADRHLNHHQPLLQVQHQELHPNGNLRVLYDNTQSQPSDPPPNHCDRPVPPGSSDHTTQIGLQRSTSVSSGAGSDPKEAINIVYPHKVLESERKNEIVKTDDTGRKGNILCPEASSHASTGSPSSPPTGAHLVLDGWFKGDRLIPIKKRRGSVGKRVNHDLEEDDVIMEVPAKLKTKKNEKCVTTQEVSATSPKKNKKRGNVIMEGSRCSRVNGRGWRCCQQTLVGYSLCEHHLGKGRLRSMTSVRGRAQKVALKEQESEAKQDKEVEMILIDDDETEDDEEEEESMSSEEGLKKLNRKKKLGVVKARSLSSLLSKIGS